MAPVRRAVIDVGTNSVKLLVADVAEHSVTPIFEESEQTRLGKGFYETHQLQRDAINDTASVVAQFAGVARTKNALSLRVIATSAARDAHNKQDLLDSIKTLSGLHVEIISGGQEADLVYRGVRSDPALLGQRLLIIDVGGGSAEFIVGQREHPEFAHSFPLGSVRLLEHLRPSDPPTSEELARCRNYLRTFFADYVHKILDPVLSNGREHTRLVGTGGAATILARMEYTLDKYSRQEIEGARITVESVRGWMQRLWSMPLRERKSITGLPKKRADVILTGMAIYETVLQEFGFTELRASTRGLRFAAVMEPAHAACDDVSRVS
jgi:exopolyphosphatase/guanosine-5'-triphosphate,3'-diphosphate pyrophosphatase